MLLALAPEQALERVYFDWDSTLSALEGVDALAERARQRGASVGELEALTLAAMEGRLPLEAIYALRLARLELRREDLLWLGQRYLEALVPGGAECIAALHAAGKQVHVLSGALWPALLPAAQLLGVPTERVHAALPRFDDQGLCTGVEAEPALWRADGKRIWFERHEPDPRAALFVGDGHNDLLAAESLVRFVGFGGVACRPRVRAQAELWFETPNLAPLLCAALTLAEQQQLLADPRNAPALRWAQSAVRAGAFAQRS